MAGSITVPIPTPPRAGLWDTVFLVAGPGSPTVKAMLDLPGIALLSFPRADAYTKRFPFLTRRWRQVAAATTVTSS